MLDSGVGETLLFSLDNKEVSFNNVETIKLAGLGSANEIDGYISKSNKVVINKNLIDTTHQIIIILNEDFNFSSRVGIPINGIIGYHFFENFPVLIDYDKERIIIYPEKKKFKRIIKRQKAIDLSIEKNKPYFNTDIELENKKINSKLLVDLGNSDGIWLFAKEIEGFKTPEPNFDDYLGRGFNGNIYGKRSKIKGIYMNEHYLQNPLVAIPDDSSIVSLSLVEGRKGSVGNEILKRFNLILDYPDKKMFIEKNILFNDKFTYNMAGMDIKYDDMQWAEELLIAMELQINKTKEKKDTISEVAVNHLKYKFNLKPLYSIAEVRANSPASKADFKEGDVLQKVNGKPANHFSLKELNNLFFSKKGRVIKFEIKRGTEILKKTITLEDPINP